MSPKPNTAAELRNAICIADSVTAETNPYKFGPMTEPAADPKSTMPIAEEVCSLGPSFSAATNGT